MLAIYILLAVLEFFVLNWLGKHSIASGYHRISFIQSVEDSPLFDVVFRVLAPTVFLVVTAAVWYAVGLDVAVVHYWWVTVCYFAVRWAFNVVMGRAGLLNWTKQVVVAIAAIGLSFLVAEKLLVDREAVLPSARGLTDELWIVVLGFLYLTATRVTWPIIGPSTDERRRRYLIGRYRKMQRNFGRIVRQASQGRFVEASSFAILIYESFNRPPIYQWLEGVLLFQLGIANTLGPMQVSTQVNLPSAELVRLGVERVRQLVADAASAARKDNASWFTGEDAKEPGVQATDPALLPAEQLDALPVYIQDYVLAQAAARYNIRSDYPAEVAGILDVLRAEFYPELLGKQSPDVSARDA
jgi:hypothetical protein